MLGDFKDMAESEEQKQAVLQTVEYYRSLVPDCTKASLANC